MRHLGLTLLLSIVLTSTALAEGTQQLGADQDIHENTEFKVDILATGEVINISVGNNSKDAPDPVTAVVTDPSGAQVTGSPFTIAPTQAGFLRLADELPPSPIQKPLQITTLVAGTYTVKLTSSSGDWLDPLDITVTPTLNTPVQPGKPPGGFGRVHSKRWIITGHSFTAGSTSSFYVLVPTGGTSDYTWLMLVDGLAGYRYDVLANAIGVPAPNSGMSVPKSSVSGGITGTYEIYLHVPEAAKGGTTAPTVTGFAYSGHSATCQSVVPGLGTTFSFTASAPGTYLLVIDTDNDGTFEPTAGDLSFTGAATAGVNTIAWDGKDAQGAVVAPGTYQAQISLRLGEFHFVADDVETINPGLRIFGVDPPAPKTTPTPSYMYWNDTLVNSAKYKISPDNTWPTGLSSGSFSDSTVCSKQGASGVNAHCWGDFDADPTTSPGDDAYIDTWVIAHKASQIISVVVVDPTADPDNDGLSNTEECGTTKTDPNKADTDGDGLADGVEVNGTNKTDPLDGDSDNDGLTDGAEDSNANGAVDTGETDPNKADTDGGGESDGAEVANGRDPLDPTDDFGPQADAGPPDTGPGLDTGPLPDTAPLPDTGPSPDTTPAPDAGVDVGPVVDQGPAPDTVGPQQDSGPEPDTVGPEQDGSVADMVPEPDQQTPEEDLYLYGGGCGCTVDDSDGAAGLGLVLLIPLMLLLLGRRRRPAGRSVGLMTLVLVLLAAGATRAQPVRFPVAHFKPAASPINYYVTEGGQTLPHLSVGAGLYLSYAHQPLVVYNEATDSIAAEVISYRFNMDLLLALGLWDRFEFGLAIPVTLAQDADAASVSLGFETSDLGTGLGDIRLIPKVRIATLGPLSLGLSLPLSLPVGSQENFLGADSVTFTPRAIASLDTSVVKVGFNLGFRIRGDESVQISDAQKQVIVNDDLFLSLGAILPVWKDRIDIVADLFMSVALDEQDKEEIPAELLGGLRFHLPAGFTANVGAGPGLSRGTGTPLFRIFAGVGYQYEPAPEPAEEPDQDPDRDGILGDADQCPNDPEDKDGFEDENGCPDPDNDNDGILDDSDSCPGEPEDKDGFEDENGCPDPDNDKDGVLDGKDSCLNEPEDKDGFKDEDGCPDPDNDSDGIPDVKDSCPNKPETFNNVDDQDGCPDKGKGPVKIQHGKITVPPVFFATAKDVILAKSEPTLKMVAETLKKNKWVKKVRIEGHTDDRGKDEFNMDLSQRRADSVMRFLVTQGIANSRLEARGFGETKPVEGNTTKAGRAKNRRVDFVIVDPPDTK